MLSNFARLGAATVMIALMCCTNAAALTVIFSENTTFLPDPVINSAPSSTTGTFDTVVPPPNSLPGQFRSPFQNFDGSTFPCCSPDYSLASYNSVRNGTATYNFGTAALSLSLLWGSPDTYNTISFYSGLNGTGAALGSFTGASLVGDGAHSFPASLGFGHDFVKFVSDVAFLSVVLSSTNPAFEYSNLTAFDRNGDNAPVIPLPPAMLLFGSALVGLGLLGRRRRKAAAL